MRCLVALQQFAALRQKPLHGHFCENLNKIEGFRAAPSIRADKIERICMADQSETRVFRRLRLLGTYAGRRRKIDEQFRVCGLDKSMSLFIIADEVLCRRRLGNEGGVLS
ncbi:hypothetical protein DEM27_04905 [Metarhizobium album]|uniref:Uncharacterized protein n=1 Tax=Metarhizobium album TaxID=2182425 RepID=A0A2U2DUL1_9HYPH|nr:hypothetical protein DEM27_04905 [Rhizobium album]